MSMEILSCHNKQSAYATAIKNIIFVEAHAMNIIPHIASEELIFEYIVFFANLASNWEVWTKSIFGGGPLNKHF